MAARRGAGGLVVSWGIVALLFAALAMVGLAAASFGVDSREAGGRDPFGRSR